MGILESILGVRGYPQGYSDKIRAKILQPVLEEFDQAKEKRQLEAEQQAQQQAGVGLARQMNRSGLTGNPTAQTAVGLMSDPATRAMGLKMGASLFDPMAKAQMDSEQALTRQRTLAGDQTAQEIEQARQLGPLNLQATQALIQSRQASAQASRANAMAAQSGRITQVQGTLNQRFLSQMDAPTQVADAVQQVDASLATGDSLGALAATIKLAKILDPTSVVREGEVTTVQGGIGVGAQLMNNYNKLFGSGFNPAAAETFKKVTKSVAAPVLQRGLRIEDEIRRAAAVMEADPNMAATGIGWPSQYVRRYLQGMPDPATSADFEL